MCAKKCEIKTINNRPTRDATTLSDFIPTDFVRTLEPSVSTVKSVQIE